MTICEWLRLNYGAWNMETKIGDEHIIGTGETIAARIEMLGFGSEDESIGLVWGSQLLWRRQNVRENKVIEA